ncbi:phosphopantetheinyl transferase [Sulfitobacter sp. SK012]|uniref:4'-phosphopantetheinyl transferase family protein n=1 Tax=Sulfitobacter sp. SK012 TaxID=1389005 RepID=UPI000E0B0DDF|nr:4'-phosphopantetheinyl transferase superfamily protein [Sulfitobacter sp. SK012]AXI45924.1 phosphopantetheinyl transferase [Sulfitobacter sp. SK012]
MIGTTARIDPQLVAALTGSIFPAGVGIAARDPAGVPGAVDPSEAPALEGAVPRRKAEFYAGRAAARAAMVQLGLPPLPVPSDLDRSPIWPTGLVGTISHSVTACVAVIGASTQWSSLGVDLEEDTPLAADLMDVVCGQAELTWLDEQPAAERGLMAKLIFCAKEATYKTQYPLTGAVFGFDHLEVTINRAETEFSACFLAPAGEFVAGDVLAGRFAHAAGMLVTGVALQQGG